MTLPTSYARVLAALRRLQPPGFYSDDDDSGIVKELGAIAVALGRASDAVETFMSDFLPDLTVSLVDRWEKALRIPVRPGDSLDVRRGRIAQILRRSKGYTLSRVAQVLAPALQCDPSSVRFVEMLRESIDAATTMTITPGVRLDGAGAVTSYGMAPWPDVVDDVGVHVEITISGGPGAGLMNQLNVKLVHESGRTWQIWNNTGSGAWGTQIFEERSTFEDLPAAGPWALVVTYSGGLPTTLVNWRLRVSNDVDSCQIYNFFVYRDPLLFVPAGLDLAGASLLLRHTAAAHLLALLVERTSFAVDDAHSLCDRDPLGV